MVITVLIALGAVLAAWGGLVYLVRRRGPSCVQRICPQTGLPVRGLGQQPAGDPGSLGMRDFIARSLPEGLLPCDKECPPRPKR